MSAAVPILMYHKVARVNPRSTLKGHYVSPRQFAKQMALLAAKRYTVVPLADVLSPDLPERPIAITFDDGYENFFLNALPVLVRHGYPATVFLVANCLGRTNAWDEAVGDVSERLMSVQQICEAKQAGADFGSHSLDHADLPTLTEAQAWTQIAESREKLEDALQFGISSFCYPYGRKTQRERDMVSRAGYKLACSTQKGVNGVGTDPFALKRINVRRDTYLPIFMYKLRRDVTKDD